MRGNLKKIIEIKYWNRCKIPLVTGGCMPQCVNPCDSHSPCGIPTIMVMTINHYHWGRQGSSWLRHPVGMDQGFMLYCLETITVNVPISIRIGMKSIQMPAKIAPIPAMLRDSLVRNLAGSEIYNFCPFGVKSLPGTKFRLKKCFSVGVFYAYVAFWTRFMGPFLRHMIYCDLIKSSCDCHNQSI